ncbi:MAG: GLUG motif-containing protein, partial [Promethearchaeota archaeon]
SAHWPTDFGNPPPQKEWGLAECSNYQFLSYSTVFKSSGLQSFPHPAKVNTRVDWTYTPPGEPKEYYRMGYDLPHLARVTYTTFYALYIVPVFTVETTTTEDTRVYEDYAKRTIPRTIDYTTGLMNYFFRGRLSVVPNVISCGNCDVELTISNNSNNSGVAQTLKGGTFELYWDNEDGDRTKVSGFTVEGWGSSSSLAYGADIVVEFTPPTPPEGEEISGYVLVYKGAINNSEYPDETDEDDPEAIAVATMEVAECDCGSGDGSEENPYVICTLQQLQAINDHKDWHYILHNSIDASDTSTWNGGAGFIPIGDATSKFTGSFNGNNGNCYVISNLYINRATNFVGLFGYTDASATIQNVRLTNANVTGLDYVGALVGRNYATVTGCTSSGSVVADDGVGGLIGLNDGATVTDCHSTCSVGGDFWVGGLVGYTSNGSNITNCSAGGIVTGIGRSNNVGGLVGYNYDGDIADCYATGSVYIQDVGYTNSNHGGLVGINMSGNTISDCYATGNIVGNRHVGGLVGDNKGTLTRCYATGNVSDGGGEGLHIGGLLGYNDDNANTNNCYATGSVTALAYAGGFLGRNDGTVTNCYSVGSVIGGIYAGGLVAQAGMDGILYNSFWDIETSGVTTSADGIGKTTAQMKQENTYTNWDFVDIWDIDEGVSYPFLRD